MEGNVAMAVADVMFTQTIISFVLALIIIFCLVELFRWALGMRKSQHYRKFLSDMYVVGMIKKFCKKDDVDLVAEEENFNRWCKKKRLKYLDVDNSIEEDLKERIGESKFRKLPKD